MARQRTKSWQDINNQQKRLESELISRWEEATRSDDHEEAIRLGYRAQKVRAIGRNYKENISNQKADYRDQRRLDKLVDKYNDDRENNRRVSEEYARIADRNGKRQWARSTYMGLSNK